MTRLIADIRRAAAPIRRHGAIAALAAAAIATLIALAGLILADRRDDAARTRHGLASIAAERARDILAQERRVLDQLAAAAAVAAPGAPPALLTQAPALAPGIQEAAQIDPTRAVLAQAPGRLGDTSPIAPATAAAREAMARPGTDIIINHIVDNDGQPVLGLARAYFADDGAVGGTVLIAIDRSAFAALDQLPGLPPGARFDLPFADGSLLFAEAGASESPSGHRVEIDGFPLALAYHPGVGEAAWTPRRAAAIALAAIALAAIGGLVALSAARRRLADREIARLTGVERALRAEIAAAAALADRSDELHRTKSQFFAEVTHELRTPLNAILGFSETIRQEMFGPVTNPRYIEYAGLINDAGSHLLSLINDLLDNARIEAGKVEVVPIRMSAAALARSALDLVELLAEQRAVAITTRGLTACPDLSVDPRAMKQVLVNLLANAIKYTPAGGRIELRFAGRSDGGVAIAVADTGIGMSAADAALAFEPFGRAVNGKAWRQQGTGLGLALARALVRLHGGDLTLTSRLNAGTTATVSLPATAAFAVPDAAKPAAAA